MKMLNKTWSLQPLDLFSKEFQTLCLHELQALYPAVNVETINTTDKSSSRINARFGTDPSHYIQVELKLTPAKKNIRPVTKFEINLMQEGWDGDVRLNFERDSRYYQAISNKPYFVFEAIVDEIENYFNSLLVYRGMKKKVIYLSRNMKSGERWEENEIVLIDNFQVIALEPVRFIVSGNIYAPEQNSAFEFVMALLMKPYLFSGKTFETEHFSFTFYNDKRKEAYTEWQEEIQQIKKGD